MKIEQIEAIISDWKEQELYLVDRITENRAFDDKIGFAKLFRLQECRMVLEALVDYEKLQTGNKKEESNNQTMPK